MKFILIKPELTVVDKMVIYHDFYYYSDEFVVKDAMEVSCQTKEGSYKGYELQTGDGDERLPLLSTWCCLHRQENESGKQDIFVFYKNKWWTVANANNLDISREDNLGWSLSHDLTWCGCCNKRSLVYCDGGNWHGHSLRDYVKMQSLYEDNSFHELYTWALALKDDFSVLPIIADWLEERGDSFSEYLREVSKEPYHGVHFPYLDELRHKCAIIGKLKSYRVAKLLILAQIIQQIGIL